MKLIGFGDALEVYTQFDVDVEITDGLHIELAAYTTEQYEGYACVVFWQHGKLWIVEGSHCSCNGLEGQWFPTETTWEAIRLMLDGGWKPGNDTDAAAFLRERSTPWGGFNPEISELEEKLRLAKERFAAQRQIKMNALLEHKAALEAELKKLNTEMNDLN